MNPFPIILISIHLSIINLNLIQIRNELEVANQLKSFKINKK